MLLWAPLAPFFFLGHPRPICFPWVSSAHFLILHSHGFTNSFRLPWTNYHILHPWGSWAFHQPLTFLIHYFGPIVAHFYSSISHNAHGFTISFSGLLWVHLLSSRPICFLYGPMTHCYCHSSLMGLLSILLTLSCPYCWAFPKWASTIITWTK